MFAACRADVVGGLYMPVLACMREFIFQVWRMGLQLPQMSEKHLFIRVAEQSCVLRAWERLAFRFNVERSPAVCECCI